MFPPPPWTVRLTLALGAVALIAGQAQANLALHRPVTASSTRFGTPAGVVNGAIEWGTYALHTQHDKGAWVLIDLQGVHRLDEVVVYGRGDGFVGETGPFDSVSLSLDGRTFHPAGRCPALTSQVTPCHVPLASVPARYVRLEHPDCLVVSEIEVHGSR